MSRASMPWTRPRRVPAGARRPARGGIAVMGIFWLAIAAICLMAIDIGHVFWQQREVQRIADLSALAGASGEAHDCERQALASARRNGLRSDAELAGVQCGNWNPRERAVVPADGPGRPAQYFAAAREPFNAARVTVARTVPYFFVFGGDASRTLSATATAAKGSPLAALNIRSTLLEVDTRRSLLLNALIGGLLGGHVELSVASWNGLANTQINLLSYLDALAVDLGLQVGAYEQLLQAEVGVGRLLKVAARVLEKDGHTAALSVDAANGLAKLGAAVPSVAPLIRLGDLLHVQTGVPAAGLDVGLDLLQLVQGVVQVSNARDKRGLVADLSADLLGLTQARVALKVIEPPQISAIGNPELARLDPMGPDRIFVRTAQVRALVSVDLPVLDRLTPLTNAIKSATSGVTTVLNDVLRLNLSVLADVLGCLFVCTREVTDIDLLPPPLRLDIGIDVGGGQSRVADARCDSDERQLSVLTRTTVADIRVGRMGASAEAAHELAFSSTTPPSPEVLPVLDIGTMRCTRLLIGLLPVKCDEAGRRAFRGGGLGISSEIAVGWREEQQVFVDPPRLNEPARYQSIATADIVGSLSQTLRGLNLLHAIPPARDAQGPALGRLLQELQHALGGVIDVLRTTVSGLLSPLLDPLLNTVLRGLGIDVARTEVGGRLSCAGGVELVY